MEENTKISEIYKKAYNQADIICQYMPHLLKSVTFSDEQPSEFSKGFQDRIKQFEQERQKVKDISIKDIKSTYGKKSDKGKTRGLDKN